ncbi:hypothetical protein GA0070612_3720 [Micromonospora chokoriensis]|uniref:Uncharacterized protein n=1 Tax=Micromonospora chokoriensis TaxID=356851 RepID=A0A1C4XKX1_9ACTN|nr:hypothetical protein GA0070612_3720 [Micromonospora chokoriensis]
MIGLTRASVDRVVAWATLFSTQEPPLHPAAIDHGD